MGEVIRVEIKGSDLGVLKEGVARRDVGSLMPYDALPHLRTHLSKTTLPDVSLEFLDI